ncbi:MAG: hypothetical protein C4292_05530 [Nitrososphaera sp.]
MVSAELQPVYHHGWGSSAELRYVVTIRADRYLLDRTGEHPAIVTFRESGFGCAYPFHSEVDLRSPYAVEHREGEKTLFFIYKLEGPYLGEIEGDWASFAYFDKFSSSPSTVASGESDDDIKNNNNTPIQSRWQRQQGKEPVPAQELEAEIRSIIVGTQQ